MLGDDGLQFPEVFFSTNAHSPDGWVPGAIQFTNAKPYPLVARVNSARMVSVWFEGGADSIEIAPHQTATIYYNVYAQRACDRYAGSSDVCTDAHGLWLQDGAQANVRLCGPANKACASDSGVDTWLNVERSQDGQVHVFTSSGSNAWINADWKAQSGKRVGSCHQPDAGLDMVDLDRYCAFMPVVGMMAY